MRKITETEADKTMHTTGLSRLPHCSCDRAR
jgi:hypothetical protein